MSKFVKGVKKYISNNANLHSYIRHNQDKLQDQSLPAPLDYTKTVQAKPKVTKKKKKKTVKKVANKVIKKPAVQFVKNIVSTPSFKEVILPIAKQAYQAVKIPKPNHIYNIDHVEMPRKNNKSVKRKGKNKARVSKRNFAVPSAFGNRIQSMTSPNTTRIAKQEMLFTVKPTGTPFDVDVFECNVGLPDCFPWLSNIANAWDRYRFEYLSFSYVPTSSTSEFGRVILAFDFDPKDSAPQNKQAMMQQDANVVATPWVGCQLTIPSFKLNMGGTGGSGWYLTRNAAAIQALSFYDPGVFQVGTQDTSTNAIGEIWVSYAVILSQQQQNPLPVSFKGNYGSTAANVFNTAVLLAGDVSHFFAIALVASAFSPNRVGQYEINWTITAATNLTVMAITLAAGDAVLTVISYIVNAAANGGMLNAILKVNSIDPDVPINLAFAATVTVATTYSTGLRLAEYDYSLS